MNETKPLMPKQWEFDGKCERIAVREWPNQQPRYVAVLSHGAAEHIGRYDHVAEALVRHGAAVFGPDHLGHGRSAGARMLIRDFEDVVADLHSVAGRAVAQHPGIPLVLIGHSMGGMIAARFAQRYGGELSALVLSGPVIGPWPLPGMLLAMDPFPEIPIDPAVLSRDLEVGRAYAADPLVWHGPLTAREPRSHGAVPRRHRRRSEPGRAAHASGCMGRRMLWSPPMWRDREWRSWAARRSSRMCIQAPATKCSTRSTRPKSSAMS